MSALGKLDTAKLEAIVAGLPEVIRAVEVSLASGNPSGFGVSSEQMRKLLTAAKMGRDFCNMEISRNWGTFG